jgi:hypothetical protein
MDPFHENKKAFRHTETKDLRGTTLLAANTASSTGHNMMPVVSSTILLLLYFNTDKLHLPRISREKSTGTRPG